MHLRECTSPNCCVLCLCWSKSSCSKICEFVHCDESLNKISWWITFVCRQQDWRYRKPHVVSHTTLFFYAIVATAVIQLITQICLGCKFWQQHYQIAVHHVGKRRRPLMLYLMLLHLFQCHMYPKDLILNKAASVRSKIYHFLVPFLFLSGNELRTYINMLDVSFSFSSCGWCSGTWIPCFQILRATRLIALGGYALYHCIIIGKAIC